MKAIHTRGISFYLTLNVFLAIFVLGTSDISAQTQISIKEIFIGGQPATQASITITLPNATPKLTPININLQFPSGTLFEIPANTVVTLSSNNNFQRLGPGSKHLAQVSTKGETHKTFWGSVTHYVNNALSFYKASGSNTDVQGAVKGTVFNVESAGKNVKFSTSEGSVQMQKKVGVQINQQSQLKRKQERELQTIQTSNLVAGAPARSYDYNNNEVVKFATYQEAVDAFMYQLDQAYVNGEDAEYLADEYTLVGELYLDMGEPHNAIEPLQTALSLYIAEIDPYDPLNAISYLLLAEAYYEAEYFEEGDNNWIKAQNIFIDDLNYNVELYNYFVQYTDDTEMIWSIGMDLVDNYDNLGWGYDVFGDYDKADYYYGLSDKLYDELGEY
jgi:tetratricopeptide (TPR) repeat protein